MTLTTRTPIPQTPTVTDTVTVTLDGGEPLPGQLAKWREIGRFGYVINWTVTVPGIIGDAYLVPPRHYVLAITLPAGRTVYGGGIISTLSHARGQTTIHGEGPLTDCPHTDSEIVEFTGANRRPRRLEVCKGCTRFVDLDKTPNRTL